MRTKIRKNALHTINYSAAEMAETLMNADFPAIKTTSSFPLATYRDFVYQNTNLNRVLISKMRRTAASIMTTEEKEKFVNTERKNNYKPPLEFCGVNMGFLSKAIAGEKSKENPTVDIVKSQDDKIHLRNLAACAMIWRCPVCSLKIMKGREKSIYALAKAHERAGLKTGFVTLTIPHKRYDKLKDTLENLTQWYREIQKPRWFREFRAGCKRKGKETAAKMLGQVKSVEITWKYLNGWHPHLHILYFYSGDCQEQEIAPFQNLLIKKWCELTGATARGQSQALCYDNDVSGYLAKWDAVKEITGEQLKRGKGITPFGMLKKIALKDYSGFAQRFRLANLYQEYAEATKGKHRISFGKNLKKAYPQEIDESTDEELVHKIDVKEVLAQIHLEVWKQITHKQLQPHIINAYLMRGINGLAELLQYKNIDFEVHQEKDEIPQFI